MPTTNLLSAPVGSTRSPKQNVHGSQYAGYKLSLVCHHVIEINQEMPESMAHLNKRANQEFFYILRREVENFVFTGISGTETRILETDEDLRQFLIYHYQKASGSSSSKIKNPSIEVRLSEAETKDVMNYFFKTIEKKDKEIKSLKQNVEDLRRFGYGYNEAAVFMLSVKGVPDEKIVEVITTIHQGSVQHAITAMTRAQEDVWINEECTRVLALWSAERPDNLMQIWQLGGVDAVVCALNNFRDNVDICQNGTHLIARVCTDPNIELLRFCCEKEVLKPILQAMHAYPERVLLQQYGCWVMGLICANAEGKRWLLNSELDFIAIVVYAMQSYPDELYITRYGISVIHSMSTEDAGLVVKHKCLPVVLSALSTFGEDSYVVCSSLKSLVNVAQNNVTKTAIIDSYMIQTVVNVLKLYNQQVAVSRHALQLFSLLTSDSSSAQKQVCVDTDVVLKAIQKAIATPHEDSETHALSLLVNITKNRELKEDLVNNGIVDVFFVGLRLSGGRNAAHQLFKSLAIFTNDVNLATSLGMRCEEVIQLMERFLDYDKVQVNGCYILGTLAVNPEIKTHIGEVGGIHALLNAAYTHSDQARVILQASAALAVLAELPEHKMGIREAKGLPIIFACLQAHAENPEVTKQLCKLIALLALDQENQEVFLRTGIIEDLMSIVCAHSKQRDLVYYGLKCVTNLLAVTRELDLETVNLEFVKGVIMIMSIFLQEVRIQESACECLSSLARSPAYQEVIAAEKGLDAILHGMQAHPGHLDVQRKACWALANLGERPNIRRMIRENGGLDLIVASVKTHGAQHPDVAEQGCAALANLALDDESRKRIAQCGGIEAILQCLTVQHAGVQAHGLGALGNLAVQHDLRVSILKADVLQLLLEIIRAHADDVRVSHFGCLALANFAHDQHFKTVIAQVGGIQCILGCMDRHLKHPGVIEQACGALANLGVLEQNMRAIAEYGGIERVVKGLRRHLTDLNVQENACFALSKFLTEKNLRMLSEFKRRMSPAIDMIERINESNPSFDVRVCTNVLLRRLIGEEDNANNVGTQDFQNRVGTQDLQKSFEKKPTAQQLSRSLGPSSNGFSPPGKL